MEKRTLEVKNEQDLKTLIGITEEQLEIIIKKFEEVRDGKKTKEYEEAIKKGERVRKQGGGRKGVLSSKNAVAMVLFYLKDRPTFNVLGKTFGLSRSRAHDNLYKNLALLEEILREMDLLPKQGIKKESK